MSVREVLASAADHQVELWFEGERLRYRAPSGTLPPEVRASLAEHKDAILAALREQAAQSVQELPLSYGQQALWYLHQSDPHNAAYNVAFTGRIHSPVNKTAFRNALQALVDRHATLRTTYQTVRGAPVQRVSGYWPVPFEPVDLSGSSESELYERVRQAYLQPFDLESEPPLRIYLFSSAPDAHVLLFKVHHLAVDGWSVWILLDELRQLYAAHTGQGPANLARPPAEYGDFVRWQSQKLSGAEDEALWAYWKEQLDGELPVLDIHTDRPRPRVQSFNGASVDFCLDADITLRLKTLAKAHGATLYMLLFAAFQVFLHRYSGQDDIITGAPTFGRSKAEFARVVGDFINMIPVRADLSGNPRFSAYLAQARQGILSALEHQDYPFPRLVARLGGQRDASRSPVFQVTFDVQRLHSFGELSGLFIPGNHAATVDFAGLALQPYPMPQQEGQFDLGLLMMEVEDILPATLKYNTDLFEAATARRMADHFLNLLAGIAADPDRLISDYPLISPQERKLLLEDWNATQSLYPKENLAHELFEDQVERAPDATAVVFEEVKLSYRELNRRANQLAHYLRGLDVGPGKMAGIFLERSVDMAVALLGVLKTGAAYVPIDPLFPPDRIGYILEDTQMPVILTQQALTASLPNHGARLVVLDEVRAEIESQPQDNLPRAGEPEGLAYVIFTSGSTGRPKGVQIPHRALVNFLHAMQKEPGIVPADVLASVTTLSFDISGLEIFLPLISGARVVILSAGTASDGFALAEAIQRYEVTMMQATPATWRLLVETGWEGSPSLKMLCGGEALPLPLAKQLLEKGDQLWNLYGPTETTIWSTIARVSQQDAVITIGRPIANTEIYILDQSLNPTPVGVSGALYIGGDGLARGYLGRPELTAEKFIPHPFEKGQADPSRRVYHTGDLARYLPDGQIEYLGRTDSQVKIRGFRIELGEIEAVLNRHPGVRQGVVIVREDTPGEQRLTAYVTANSDKAPKVRELRAFLKEKLPTYMIPAAYVFLDTFPLTPNGKINRRALPSPTQTSAESHASSQPPTTPLEILIAEAWKKVLQVEQVGVYDNFFDLGGHSLLAMQAVAEIQEQTGHRLEPAYLRFESLGQLAVTLESQGLTAKG